jgi:hypothetical protein
MSAVEIAEILDRIKAPYETRIEAIPQDSKDTKSLGMDLSTRLLKRRLGIDWEDYFFNEGGMYIVLPEDAGALRLGIHSVLARRGSIWIR